MSARPALCGGYHVSGIPTAIVLTGQQVKWRIMPMIVSSPFLLGFSVEANDHLLTRTAPSRDRSVPDCASYCCIFLRQDNFPATTSGIPGSTGHPEAHQF